MGEILGDLFTGAGYPVVLTSRFRSRSLRLIDLSKTLIRRHREIDIQILQVYSGLSFVGEDVASWLGQRLGQKVILHVHGGAIPEFLGRYPRWGLRVLKRAHAIVCPSPFLARSLASHGFRCQIIPNVLDLPVYPFRLRRQLTPRLFWMRAFHPAYNPEMALRVLARVRKVIPEATLVMAGPDKGTRDNVRRLSHDLGLDAAVNFPGYLNMAAKVREGDAADIFINTNHVDNMPVSILEACAMGLPVVTTNVGGIPDLLDDGETGILVYDNDDQAMAEWILRLLRNPELAARISANGRTLAERSSWEQVRPQWERLFSDVMSQSYGKGVDIS
jgi:glycosyltransferase involved in cell wall biosynthesis